MANISMYGRDGTREFTYVDRVAMTMNGEKHRTRRRSLRNRF